MKREKRGQEGVIVTVILILVAIAAVAAISVYVIKMVKESSSSANDQTNCIKLNYEIVNAIDKANNISVKRNAGGDDIKIKSLKILAGGITVNETAASPEILETGLIKVNSALVLDQTVEVAVILDDNFNCGIKATKAVTAA